MHLAKRSANVQIEEVKKFNEKFSSHHVADSHQYHYRDDMLIKYDIVTVSIADCVMH